MRLPAGIRRKYGPLGTLIAALVVGAGLLMGETSLANYLPAQDDPSDAADVVDNWEGNSPAGDEIHALLDQVEVIPARPTVAGYDRDCGSEGACSFGPAWSDDTTADLGHDGCDTRNNMLALSLDQPVFREGTHDCVVIAGHFLDPYTGEEIEFRKESASEVQVDHVIPLALAHDLGAANWPLETRKKFANDPTNLVVVSGPANGSKGDSGPGEWMPINRGYRCTYVHRYLTVATEYGLPVTEADRAAIEHVADTCPSSPAAQ